jgi:hypothetical protein
VLFVCHELFVSVYLKILNQGASDMSIKFSTTSLLPFYDVFLIFFFFLIRDKSSGGGYERLGLGKKLIPAGAFPFQEGIKFFLGKQDLALWLSIFLFRCPDMAKNGSPCFSRGCTHYVIEAMRIDDLILMKMTCVGN